MCDMSKRKKKEKKNIKKCDRNIIWCRQEKKKNITKIKMICKQNVMNIRNGVDKKKRKILKN